MCREEDVDKWKTRFGHRDEKQRACGHDYRLILKVKWNRGKTGSACTSSYRRTAYGGDIKVAEKLYGWGPSPVSFNRLRTKKFKKMKNYTIFIWRYYICIWIHKYTKRIDSRLYGSMISKPWVLCDDTKSVCDSFRIFFWYYRWRWNGFLIMGPERKHF